MPVMTLTKVDTTKTGKTRAYFDNKTHWKDAFYLGKSVVLPPIGTVMDCHTVAKRFDNAEQDTWFLQGWAPVSGAAAPSAVQAAPVTPAAPVAATPPGGLRIDSGDQLRFISNMVGSAITAGTIKKPDDMALWAKSAFMIVRGLERGVFNDPDKEPKAKPAVDLPAAPPAVQAGDPGPFADPFDDSMNDKVPF